MNAKKQADEQCQGKGGRCGVSMRVRHTFAGAFVQDWIEWNLHRRDGSVCARDIPLTIKSPSVLGIARGPN